MLPATAGDHRIKAAGTVSAVDIARQFRLGADGAQDPAVFQGMLDAAAAARTAEARGEGAQSFQPCLQRAGRGSLIHSTHQDAGNGNNPLPAPSPWLDAALDISLPAAISAPPDA